jgi:hypothetical protein
VKVYNTTVYWHGGNNGGVSCANCSTVEPNATFLAPDYACNMENNPPPASPGMHTHTSHCTLHLVCC